MIPLIGILLCIYLAFKGVEILQLALTSNRQNRVLANIIGIVAVVLSFGIAIQFAIWFIEQGAEAGGLGQ